MSIDLLDKLSKRTPQWAVGVVSILVAISATFVAVYSTSKDEIVQAIAVKEKVSTKEYEERDRIVGTILELVNVNSNQITNLSVALQKTQEQNIVLTNRISVIELELSKSNTNLKVCETELAKCKKPNRS